MPTPNLLQRLSEGLARRTSRRGLMETTFGVLAGAAAGAAIGSDGADAGIFGGTVCAFPGPPCPCDRCMSTGVCAKPCVMVTVWYASGCWSDINPQVGPVTCCDCQCEAPSYCGCGSDYHNAPVNCPGGTAG
jgi:hypothetical protein